MLAWQPDGSGSIPSADTNRLCAPRRYTTVELFNQSLTKNAKLKALLEILSNASEFDEVPVRHKEDIALRKLAMHLPLKITPPKEGVVC